MELGRDGQRGTSASLKDWVMKLKISELIVEKKRFSGEKQVCCVLI